MKSNAIGPVKKGEKGHRPSGDRPVELGIVFVCNKVLTPRVGYVEEKQLLAPSHWLLGRKTKSLDETYWVGWWVDQVIARDRKWDSAGIGADKPFGILVDVWGEG